MNKNAKIVIVGAGISGISSAILLQILGYTNITIIDKESYIGGKAHSIHINNESIETGAVFITEGSKKLLNLLKILNCKILPIDERSYIYIIRKHLKYLHRCQQISKIKYYVKKEL